jgi:hypothetical protein
MQYDAVLKDVNCRPVDQWITFSRHQDGKVVESNEVTRSTGVHIHQKLADGYVEIVTDGDWVATVHESSLKPFVGDRPKKRYSVDVNAGFGSQGLKDHPKLMDLPTINPDVTIRGGLDGEAGDFYADFSFESDANTLEAAEEEALEKIMLAIAAAGVVSAEVWLTGTYDNHQGIWLTEY